MPSKNQTKSEFEYFDHTRCADSHPPGYGGGRQPQLCPAPYSDLRPCSADLPPFASSLQFPGIDSAPAALLFDDLLESSSRPGVLELPQVPFFRFFQDLVDEFASSQDSLIKFFFLPPPSHGEDLRPAALASDEASAGQFFDVSLPDSLPHEPAVSVDGLPAGVPELRQYAVRIHPSRSCLADDDPVPAPGVAAEFLDGLNDPCADGIEMDVADQGQEVVVFVAENGFVAVLEQVAGSFVPAVVVLGVPGEEFPHDAGHAVFAALKEDVDVIPHEDPCVDSALPFTHGLTKPLKETASVLVVSEYVCFIDTPDHDVV